MSDILFNPHTKSNILPRDVLNIIGTYVKHPLSDLIKKEVRHEITSHYSQLKFNKKTITYWRDFCELTGDSKIISTGIFEKRLYCGSKIPYSENKKFKFVGQEYAFYLQNVIPMHQDTFICMYFYFQDKYDRDLNY